MAGKLQRFQTLTFTHWKGLTKDNHLNALFKSAPQKATNLMVLLLATRRGKTLESLLSSIPTKEFESDDEYTWELIGSSRRNIPLKYAIDEDGKKVTANVGGTNGMVGANTAPFYLVFPEDWFADGEVIVGNLNEVYLFRILGDAIMRGTEAMYKVELENAA